MMAAVGPHPAVHGTTAAIVDRRCFATGAVHTLCWFVILDPNGPESKKPQTSTGASYFTCCIFSYSMPHTLRVLQRSDSRDASLDGSYQLQFAALRDDWQAVLSMVIDEVADTVKDKILGSHNALWVDQK